MKYWFSFQTALSDQKLGPGHHSQLQLSPNHLEAQQQHHNNHHVNHHLMYSGQAAYGGEAYYGQQQQQQWDYGQMSPYYHSYHQPQQQHQYHLGYSPQQYGQHSSLQQQQQPQYRDELSVYHTNPMTSTTPLPPGRSPSGSHSTPSPHSQSETPELTDLHPLDQQQQQQQLKRSHLEAFRSDNNIGGGGGMSNQNMMVVAAAAAAAAAAKKPKVSRRKKKRDPNEPQKPVSAYALFFRDSQAAIKARNPNLSFGDVSKMVASMWDSLDAESKALYKKRTEMAKKEYLRQLAAYRASLVSKGGEEMYGGYGGANGGYGGYGGSMGHHPSMGLGQSIPAHPPGPYMASSPDYLGHQV